MALSISPSPFGTLSVTVAETQGSITVNTVATSPSVLTMALGVPGPAGAAGAQGPAGSNGSNGQNGVGVPTGGTTGQSLVKSSGTDYATTWASMLPLSGGNVTGEVSFIGADLRLYGSQIRTEGGITFGGDLWSSLYQDGTLGGTLQLRDNNDTYNTFYTSNGIIFSDSTTQTTSATALLGNYLTTSSAASTYLTQVSAANTYFLKPTGTTSDYIDGTGGIVAFPTVSVAGKMTLTAYNGTGSTIAQGSVIYISGAHGNDPQVSLAKADAESTSAYTIGVAQSSIPNNTNGTFVTAGLLEGINTNAYSDGTPLYLSGTVAGGLTSTKQFSPYHYVKIGTVIRAHPTQGSIFIKVENGYQLDELSDCFVTAPANNNVLAFESSSQLWKDKSISTLLGYTAANTALGNLSSVTTARSNLGLGDMALETASNYLTKAGNLSGLTSATTARTNLGLAYATDAQVIAGTSASTVMTPAQSQFGIQNWLVLGTTSIQSATSTGSVLTSTYGSRAALNSTASGQYAILYSGNQFVQQTTTGSTQAEFNFSKRTKIYARIGLTQVANCNAYYAFGRAYSTASTIGSPAAKGYGIRIQGTGAVELQVHNGTSLSNVTSSFTPTSNTSFDCLIDSIGDGNVNLYINGSLVATSSAGPTGSYGSNQNPALIQELSSTGNSSGNLFTVTSKAIYMA